MLKLMRKIIRVLVLKSAPHLIQTYRYAYAYRVHLSGASGRLHKLILLVQCVLRPYLYRRKILFYPDGPRDFHAIYKVLFFLGYRITSDPREKCDLGIRWWLAFDGNPFAPEIPFPKIKERRQSGARLLNIHCKDISKVQVSRTFEEVFGYSLSVDPRHYSGKCVMKLNWNALHEGQIVKCPTEPQEGDWVYQKLVRNETEEGLVEDMRVPVFGKITPFVYLKYRRVNDRFVDRVHTNTKATIAEVQAVLSDEEMKKIYHFCEKIGLDCGDLDVLRDRINGRIYIVDVNNTPSGPPSPISDDDGKIAVLRLSQAFQQAFEV